MYRYVFQLILLLCGLLLAPRLFAQDYSQCHNNGVNDALCPDRATAYSVVMLHYTTECSSPGYTFCTNPPNLGDNGVNNMNLSWQFVFNGQGGTHNFSRSYSSQCENPEATYDPATHTCDVPKECSPDDPPLTGGFMKYEGSEPGYQTCADGCEYNPSSMTYQTGTVDGIKFVSLAGWIPSGANCTVGPNDGYVPPSDADSDGVSDEHDADPNNPGNSNQKDDPSKPKGETKEEGDGSGNGNQSSGGGNCQQAPNSSGDAILAQIAYQAWATRCAIEGLKDADGNVKTNGGKDGGGGATSMTETNTILTAIKDLLKPIRDFIGGVSDEVGGLDTDDGTGENDVDSVWGQPATNDDLNSGGLGWLRSCPVLPTLTIGGYTGQVDDGTLCTVMQAVGALILLLAYFQAGLIIGRS